MSLSIGEIRNFDLVGVGENYRWLCNWIKVSLRDLLHGLQFADVSLEEGVLYGLMGDFL